MHAPIIALALVTAVTTSTAVAAPRTRVAQDDEDDYEDDEDDDDEDLDEDLDEDEEDPDQPPVTAGGLYTIETYPRTESQRPLSMTKDLIEFKLGVGVDATNQNAFRSAGAVGDVRYGLQDNIELRAGFWGIKNFSAWQADVSFEGSIIYELVDLRVGLRVARTADTQVVVERVVNDVVTDVVEPRKGELTASIPIGVPFRYSPRAQVAVTVLETLFAIDDGPPDALPSVGIVIQPAPVVALLINASVAIEDFDFSVDHFVVPVSAAVQLTPNNRLDLGLEFRFGNHNLPAGTDANKDGEADTFYDDRFLFFFARYRR